MQGLTASTTYHLRTHGQDAVHLCGEGFQRLRDRAVVQHPARLKLAEAKTATCQIGRCCAIDCVRPANTTIQLTYDWRLNGS